MFDTLIESGHSRAGKKKWYMAPISVLIHGVIIGTIILVPILFPGVVSEKINVRLFAPPPPPPPPPPPAAAAAPKPVVARPDAPPKMVDTSQIAPVAPTTAGKGSGEGGIGVIGGVIGGTAGGGSSFLNNVAPSAAPEADRQPPVMVTANMTPPKLIQQVNPEYPTLAKKAGVEGTVLLRLVIGTDGRVQKAEVLTVLPPKSKGIGLEDEAIKAVMQWKFSPALSAGKPVKVYYNVPVKFVLR